MNKTEYLSILDSSLRSLPPEERREVIEFYYSYFDDAMENGKTEQQIIDELGAPGQIVSKILADNGFKAKSAASQYAFQQASQKNSVWSGLKGVVLAVVAILVGLPGALIIGIPLACVALGLLIALFCIILGLGIAAVAIAVAFCIASVQAFIMLPQTGPAAIGWAIMFMGLGIFFGTLIYQLAVLIIKGVSVLSKKLLNRVEESRRKKAVNN